MKSAVINGMDLFSVYKEMKAIADDVRKTSEPWFVEIRTYRYRGHSMSDPQKYRTKEELAEYQKIDPLEKLRGYLLENKLMTEKAMKDLEAKIDQQVLDAIDFAEESPFPENEALFEDMYAGEPYFHDKGNFES